MSTKRYVVPYGHAVGTVQQDWLIAQHDLTLAARTVYGRLVRYAGDGNGSCFPRAATIATALGLGLNTVKRALALLEEMDYIEVIHRDGHSSVYSFVDHEGMPDAMRATAVDKISSGAASTHSGATARPVMAERPTHSGSHKKERTKIGIEDRNSRVSRDHDQIPEDRVPLGQDPDEPQPESQRRVRAKVRAVEPDASSDPPAAPQPRADETTPRSRRDTPSVRYGVPGTLANEFAKTAEDARVGGNGPVTGIGALQKHFSRLLRAGRDETYCREMIKLFVTDWRGLHKPGVDPSRSFIAASSRIQSSIDRRFDLSKYSPTNKSPRVNRWA